jgi:hypothetical protein
MRSKLSCYFFHQGAKFRGALGIKLSVVFQAIGNKGFANLRSHFRIGSADVETIRMHGESGRGGQRHIVERIFMNGFLNDECEKLAGLEGVFVPMSTGDKMSL